MAVARKIRASKENARKACRIADRIPKEPVGLTELAFLRDFLDAAQAKLPTDASFDREVFKRRQRRMKQT